MSKLSNRIDTTHDLEANHQDISPDENIIPNRLA